MPKGAHFPEPFDWRAVASLGEQLVSTSSLAGQRDRILAMTGRLIPGRVDVWLHENLFRLPDWEAERLFPPQPMLEGMRDAVKRHRTCLRNPGKKARTKKTFVAVSIEDQGLMLGAMQVTRSRGPSFSKAEIELIESLASIIAVGLYASHRVEVERFRLGQLNLVRQVSAQIANVLNVDELARRVTELIQRTFNYYYVGIFTIRPGAKSLRFRSSASAPRKGKKESAIALDVEIGEGLIGKVAESGERIVASDVRQDPRFQFIGHLPATRSEAVIPLKIEDRILGVLDIQSQRVDAFHPNDLLLLESLADNIARAVEGARLYGDIRRRADQLSLIAEVSRSVTSTLDLHQLMGDTARLIHQQFGFPFVHLFTVHPNRRLIEYEAGSGQRSQALEGYSIPLDDSTGIIPWVARAGQTVFANDVSKDGRYLPSPLPPKNTRSELSVPLLFNEKVIGVLDIQSDRVNAFTEDDRFMFETVAGTIAAAIRNADLYRSEHWRRQVSDSLREVAGLLSSNAGLDEVLDAILTEIERNLPVEVCAIWLLGEGDLYLAAVHGGDPQAIEQARQSNVDGSIALTRAMLSESPMFRGPAGPIGPLGQAAGFGSDYSSLAAPLHVGDQPVGVISLAHPTPGRYGHEAQAMVATFASYAAVAIENARLYDAAQEQAYASAALLQVAQAVVSLNELDEILGTIVRVMPILVGASRVALYLWDAQHEAFHPLHAYGFEGEARKILAEADLAPGSFPLLDAVRGSNCLLVHPLTAADEPQKWIDFSESWRREDEQTLQSSERLLYAVPLSVKSDVFGVLLLQETSGGRRFRARRLEIITGIAQQAALAIQNDRLQKEMVVREHLETEIQLARQIQQTFIPESLPQSANWELAARWKTARQVGGDFYDVIELPNQRLGLFIADVADKGMPAALFMALTRTLVRAAVVETPSPAEALQRVNELLMPDTKQGMFVTAVYAVLNQNTGEVTYANAGHNPPLWLKADRAIERLTRTGVALGATEARTISEKTIQLTAGESLLFYTDGLTEEFSTGGELFGEARLMEAIRSASPASAETMLDAVESSLNAFVGSNPLTDDLTMLAVRRT
ncbi:MAG TPA: GAF domain-containing protein [Anaerolineales bacterium]|nr:GAF domain-containing protein [Anaerolineales bacterium]